MFCRNCGKELKPGARFCVYCGTPAPVASPPEAPRGRSIPAGHTAPAPPPRPGIVSPTHGQVPLRAPAPLASQQRRSALIWLLVIIWIVVISIIALVVLFLIASEGMKKGPGFEGATVEETSERDAVEAEGAAWSFIRALVSGDIDAFLKAMKPGSVAALENAPAYHRKALSEHYHHVQPRDLDLEICRLYGSSSGGQAEVTVVEGTSSYAAPY